MGCIQSIDKKHLRKDLDKVLQFLTFFRSWILDDVRSVAIGETSNRSKKAVYTDTDSYFDEFEGISNTFEERTILGVLETLNNLRRRNFDSPVKKRHLKGVLYNSRITSFDKNSKPKEHLDKLPSWVYRTSSNTRSKLIGKLRAKVINRTCKSNNLPLFDNCAF
mmetsp:Transcript_18475/g.20953  ORF Transcript_18475/g.20953 Transcript_18475/m.20953 type:complete len:164 (+) Transcript_18475:239-730(+)